MIELRTAVVDALHGHLDNFLVNSSHISAVLHRLNVELRRMHLSLHTVFTSLTDVYQSNDFIIHRVGRDIYITIKFYVAPLQDTFTLYNVRRFPVTLPDGSAHMTELDTAYTAVAYSPMFPYFIEFRSPPNVRNHMLDTTRAPDLLQSTSAPSCLLPLLQNEPSRIRQYCSFKLLPDSVTPSVILLDASTVLFTNVSNITRKLTCSNVPTVILPRCTQCIYRLPCQCSFRTETTYVPPTLQCCAPHTSNRTQPAVHVNNLAILSHFFSEQDLGALASCVIQYRLTCLRFSCIIIIILTT